ncbi:MAG: glycosyltransferase [bacterium]|nr:glycosyltransferase [bacterium]
MDLSQYDGISLADQLESFVRTRLQKKDWEKHKKMYKKQAIALSDDYHQVEREKKVSALFAAEKGVNNKKSKKILMLSDFSRRVGGIETYVDDASRALQGMGHQVQRLGAWSPKGKLGKYWRYLGMFFAFGNLGFALRVAWNVLRFRPDLVWFHSSLRWMGRLSYLAVKWTSSKDTVQWMMFHDFGYFYAFPNTLVDPKDVDFVLNRKDFLVPAGKNVLMRFLLWGKYINICLIKFFAKKYIDLFLVPSEYMKKLVAKSWRLPKKKLKVLEHFVQE